MPGRKELKIAGFVMAAVAVSWFLIPPAVTWAGTKVAAGLVSIEGGGSKNVAKVSSGGRLTVSDAADATSQCFKPNGGSAPCSVLQVSNNGVQPLNVQVQGGQLIASGAGTTGTGTFSTCQAEVTAIVIDTTASATLQLTGGMNSPSGPKQEIFWQGTTSGHLDDTLGSAGVQVNSLMIAETGSGSAQWYLYGQGGGSC